MTKQAMNYLLGEMQRLGYLTRELETPGLRKDIMPGVRELLDALADRDDVYLALLTGNYEAAARVKLEYFDLWRYFACGAFGDEAPDRNGLDQRNRLAGDRAQVVDGARTVLALVGRVMPERIGDVLGLVDHAAADRAGIDLDQADQVRVSAPGKDDLQEAMRLLREHDFGVALQFGNYR